MAAVSLPAIQSGSVTVKVGHWICGGGPFVAWSFKVAFEFQLDVPADASISFRDLAASTVEKVEAECNAQLAANAREGSDEEFVFRAAEASSGSPDRRKRTLTRLSAGAEARESIAERGEQNVVRFFTSDSTSFMWPVPFTAINMGIMEFPYYQLGLISSCEDRQAHQILANLDAPILGCYLDIHGRLPESPPAKPTGCVVCLDRLLSS